MFPSGALLSPGHLHHHPTHSMQRMTAPSDPHAAAKAKEFMAGGIMVAASKALAATVEACMNDATGEHVDREKQQALKAALDGVDPRIFPALNLLMTAHYGLASAVAEHETFHQHEATEGLDPEAPLDAEGDLAILGDLLKGPLDSTKGH